jgi:hypothetical protein
MKPVGGLNSMVELDLTFTVRREDAVLQSVASACLLELISLCPSSLVESYRARIDWIRVSFATTKNVNLIRDLHLW